MAWLRKRVDRIAQIAAWVTAACSLLCAFLSLVAVAPVWIAVIGILGGLVGLTAIWAGALASRIRDDRLATNEMLTLEALRTDRSNASLF